MTKTYKHLDNIYCKKNRTCNMQVIFIDIIAYSKRKSYRQVAVIDSFMRVLESTLAETAKQYITYSQINDINLRKDVILLPSGDGVAVVFSLEGIHDIHLFFAKELVRALYQNNLHENCILFDKNGWCDCHSAFNVRIGIAEGKLILYKDVNNNYNVAGKAINMAARVMSLADTNQIFFTEDAHQQIVEMIPRIEEHFIKYNNVKIKHNLEIPVFQFVDRNIDGLNASPNKALYNNIVDTHTISHTEAKDSYISLQYPKEQYLINADISVIIQKRMIEIPPGELIIGDNKTGRMKVRIKNSFMIDKFPLTQDIYLSVMGTNPCHMKGKDLPVENISWYDAISFCNEISRQSRLEPVYEINGKNVKINYEKSGYRLPTEAEWEYACRGKKDVSRYDDIDRIAWYNKNTKQIQLVGQLKPNEYGIYDILGNVWEWCNDWYEKTYSSKQSTNPTGPDDGMERVIRGGSWENFADNIQSNYRNKKNPMFRSISLGCRIAKSVLLFEI